VVADLVLIALGIALQPFRLSAFILILSTEGGTKKGLGFILGWLTCLILVIAVVVITRGEPVRLRTVPSTVVVIVRLALARGRDHSGNTQAYDVSYHDVKSASLRRLGSARAVRIRSARGLHLGLCPAGAEPVVAGSGVAVANDAGQLVSVLGFPGKVPDGPKDEVVRSRRIDCQSVIWLPRRLWRQSPCRPSHGTGRVGRALSA
jgi:Sap, sulfolipid-1-addressing protein